MGILDGDDDLLGDITIKKHKNYFEIIFTKSYRCRISDYKENYCLVEHINNDSLSNVYFINYEDLKVKNLEELFCLLIKEPNKMIKVLTENDLSIDKFIIKYYKD